MAVNLAHLNEKILAVEGLSVEVVKDEVALMDWCTAMALGFEAPPSRVDFLVESWRNLMLKVDPDSTTAYLDRWHAKPVATSLLRLGAGVAGIYAVATIPEARRKGIGAWVTLQPLLEARTRGYHAGILQSSEMGHGVYQSIGFRDYCRIKSYFYRPKKGDPGNQ